MYELDFEATMVLVTGYDANRRAAVVKRWVELERKQETPLIPTNFVEALQLALDQAKQVTLLEHRIEADRPKVGGL